MRATPGRYTVAMKLEKKDSQAAPGDGLPNAMVGLALDGVHLPSGTWKEALGGRWRVTDGSHKAPMSCI